MRSPILVTGGTGTLGQHAVRRLREAGRPVRVLTRRAQPDTDRADTDRADTGRPDGVEFMIGDLATGAGVDAAVAGVGVIVHCASSNKGDADATRTLVRAAAAQPDPPHLVYISIVGTDLVPFGYTRTKLECERIVADSGLPWTLLRATQFYDLILTGARSLARLPVVPVPARFPVQPVATDEVAARLVHLALADPAGRVPDMGGPEVTTFADLLRTYLRVTKRRRPVVPIPVPGIRAVRAGGLVVSERQATAESVAGKVTWEEFLTSRANGALPSPGVVHGSRTQLH